MLVLGLDKRLLQEMTVMMMVEEGEEKKKAEMGPREKESVPLRRVLFC